MRDLYAHFFFLQTAARNVPPIGEKFFSALFTTQEYGVWETSMSPRGGHPKWDIGVERMDSSFSHNEIRLRPF